MIIVNERLRKCPFCGKDGVIFEDLRCMRDPLDMHRVYGVMCSNPDCIMHQEQKFYPYEEAARSAWNRRCIESEEIKFPEEAFKEDYNALAIKGVIIPNNCHECDSLGISDLIGIECPSNNDKSYSYEGRPDGCPLQEVKVN